MVPNDGRPVASLKNVNYYFGAEDLRRQVLREVTLELSGGEIVLLSGPSGSGKTTLLTLIGALRSPQDGDVTVLGENLRGAGTKALAALRRSIGYIFQGHNLLPFLTARQNVQLAAELNVTLDSAVLRERTDEALRSVGLEAHAYKFPSQMSGGQKQRVAIARALVGKPAMVLADEPTASLDSQTGREIAELLRQLALRDGTAVLLVTHDDRNRRIADRVVRMEDGVLCAV